MGENVHFTIPGSRDHLARLQNEKSTRREVASFRKERENVEQEEEELHNIGVECDNRWKPLIRPKPRHDHGSIVQKIAHH